jgi:hypothetical protein
MSEHQIETAYSRRIILTDDSDECRRLKKSVARVQPGGRLVDRFASVIALFLALALVGVGAMVALAGHLMAYRKKLKRLREARQLVTTRQESHLGKPDMTTLPGSYRGSDDRESCKGAAAGSGYYGGLDSPSWLSNKLCG